MTESILLCPGQLKVWYVLERRTAAASVPVIGSKKRIIAPPSTPPSMPSGLLKLPI